MFKKSIMLHNDDLIVELIGRSRDNDIISVLKKIKYLSSIYSTKHVIINLQNLENREDYIDKLNLENVILIY